MPTQDPARQSAPTDIVLIVKGAGSQEHGQSLDQFVSGLWAAAQKLSGSAKLGFPNASSESDETVQIQVKNKTIWMREINWDEKVRPGKPVGVFMSEWKMASSAFQDTARRVVLGPSTGGETPLMNILMNMLPVFLLLSFATSVVVLNDAIPYFPEYLGLTEFSWWSRFSLLDRWQDFPKSTQVLGVALLGMILILPRARERSSIDPAWLLMLLVIVMAVDPIAYVSLLLVVIAAQTIVLFARQLSWRHRPHSDSDTRYSIRAHGPALILVARVIMSPALYRFIVIITLPIAIVGYSSTKALRWTRILAPLAEVIESALRLTLSGTLGDVVNYAMNPAQANRIRRAIIAGIELATSEVDKVHVFAHSQGSAISYEVIFGDDIREAQRRKISTFVTIGSPLSYYAQANDVLDIAETNRFPVLSPPSSEFQSEFTWYNYWNILDPITEFFGLDEYGDTCSDGSAQNPHRIHNIRTKAALLPWQSHSRYWKDIDGVYVPLLMRITESPQSDREESRLNSDVTHARAVVGFVASAVVALVAMTIFLKISTRNGSTSPIPLLEGSKQLLSLLFGLFLPIESILDGLDDMRDLPAISQLIRGTYASILIVLAITVIRDYWQMLSSMLYKFRRHRQAAP
jgi:hypothetical protein